MLGVDLTIPIAILGTAVGIVLVVRAWVSWQDRRTLERTAVLLRDLGLEEPRGDRPVPPREPREP